ncbi:methionyl-tRNA formyltransferase [Salinivibrio proteolyticus]|uniref:Formyltransferase family protein n=1 Tax=Salinivibrio proteolyticus TaxID=334715 RepID=A0ABY7LBT9_9GAMM|nr:formyltransferase family protein [Salinivibrio proteolyticus]WBA13964.1 formyltransferase family protein [Salinivibrio proteolyticus]
MAKVTLFCMTEKSINVLDNILPHYSSWVDKVVVSRDKNVQYDYYEEITKVCKHFGVPFFDKSDVFTVDSDYCIAIGWRWLIDAKQSKLIVFHDSLLPRYRGFSPVISALINGEEKIGATALYASKDYDRGAILYQESVNITYPIKIQQAIDIISSLYAKIAVKIFERILMNEIIPSLEQDESYATYSLWRDENDYFVDWSLDARVIRRFIDAVGFPYKYAKTIVGDNCYRILEAEALEDVVVENRTPGKIIFKEENNPVVVCGSGLLKITKMKCDKTGRDPLHEINFRSRFSSYK